MDGKGRPTPGGRRSPVYEMGVAELRQEVSESRNTIYHLRKNQEPFKRQRREGVQGGRRGQDHQPIEQPGSKTGVYVTEGAAKAPGP